MDAVSLPDQYAARRVPVVIIAFAGILLYILLVHSFTLPTLVESSTPNSATVVNQPVKVVTEESLTIDTVKKDGPSVITVVGTLPAQQGAYPPFFYQQQTSQPDEIIGSGFIVSSEGLIVTNKHVVSDTSAKYQIVTANNKQYDVQSIYRDPQNDIAIIRINTSQNPSQTLQPVSLGDSSNLQVGQFVLAIGTALGQFKNSVTTGIISGLGRGIQAGDVYQGEIENLNNLIQTSAAINPGNSGGPLFNDNYQVIGVDTAVAVNGQNIGFALPVNTVKQVIDHYNASR